ncbi:MAG: hypothetical protein K5905_03635, partial [Roseibium sp.]|nr:hypothetical protein [Roseibium sp.]
MSGPGYYPVRLSMYDWPEVRAATAVLEQALHAALEEKLGLKPSDLMPWPEGLDEAGIWEQPGVLLT